MADVVEGPPIHVSLVEVKVIDARPPATVALEFRAVVVPTPRPPAPAFPPQPDPSRRKHRLVDCNPRFVPTHGEPEGREHYLRFDCPEGHEHCEHYVPFSPALDGSEYRPPLGAVWKRESGVDFETFTLRPSIARRPTIAEDGRVIDACHMHVNIVGGAFEFGGDSG